MRAILLALFLSLLSSVALAESPAANVYKGAIELAAAGQPDAAVERLAAAAEMLPGESVWRARMILASSMIRMRAHQQVELPKLQGFSAYVSLASAYLQNNPPPQEESNWVVTLLATLLPGAGHAWLGRWHDAMVAAFLVWPMLLLTLWAAYRRMGPVTVFFGLITAWLWSGTVFSAISLSERGGLEAYLLWWQGLWQASGLPGKPW